MSDIGQNLVSSQYTGTNGWVVTTDGSISYNKGVIAYAVGDSGRKGDTTHGKQKGVKYIIKVL